MKLFYRNAIVLSTLNIAVVLILAGIVFESIKNDKVENILSEKQFEINFKAADFRDLVRSNIEQTKLLSIMPEIQGIVKFTDYGSSGSFQFDEGFWSELLEEKFTEIIKNNPNIHQIQIFSFNGNEIIHIFSENSGLHVEDSNELKHSMSNDVLQKVTKLQNNEVEISSIKLSEVNNKIEVPHKPILEVTTPIFLSNDEQLGYLKITYDMQDFLYELSQSASGKMLTIDNKGYFIDHPDKSKIFGDKLGTGINYFSDQPELKKNLEISDNKFHYDEDEQEYRIWNKISYDKNDTSNYWVVVSVTTEEELFLSVEQLRSDVQLVMIPFLAITIVVTIIISRHMSKPIEVLTEKILKIKKGESGDLINIKGNNEISQLGNAFNKMTKSLSQSQHTLKEYEQAMKSSLADAKKFYNQIDQSTAISKFDINGDLTYVNEKFCKMTKYTKEELMGQNQKILRSGYHDEKFYREMWKTILSGKIWTGNLKNKAKDGSYFWEKKIIIPDENSENEIIGFLAIQIDIQDLMEKNSKDWT
ncbi:PAS domain S-box protein [Nitrosopumilus maritimus]|uniref:histidine kinase n=1 Tax=Nitrosopumilus maritimus (strain SCM1) TaxID=436308 RepID=A9A3L0_NITMS|nr:PAS domain S-box protein [Nitrosopumilus maritimus]ABX12942.1 putative PAS/PAC sensor protein [Nitrosopumilus maritimus SCM1]